MEQINDIKLWSHFMLRQMKEYEERSERISRFPYFKHIPAHIVLEIVTKMEIGSFLKMNYTNKWVSVLIEKRRNTFIKNTETKWDITSRRLLFYPADNLSSTLFENTAEGHERFKKEIAKRKNFRFSTITFQDFIDEEVAHKCAEFFKNSKIYVGILNLFSTFPSQLLLDTLKPKEIWSFYPRHEGAIPVLRYPENTDKIYICGYKGDGLLTTINNLFGKKVPVGVSLSYNLDLNDCTNVLQLIRKKLKMANSSVNNIRIDPRCDCGRVADTWTLPEITSPLYSFKSHFDSELIDWDYEIVLEETRNGAICLIHYTQSVFAPHLLTSIYHEDDPWQNKQIVAIDFIQNMSEFKKIFKEIVIQNRSEYTQSNAFLYEEEEEEFKKIQAVLGNFS